MNVLSLFDGLSCGQIAFERASIKVDKYYASEIDKYAIKVTQTNYPDTIQLGSVTDWRTWDIDFKSIGLICAGSPCQGFSFAGKQLAFDDPRSKLFFVFVEILNHCRKLNPDVKFLLENVDMKKDHLRVISEYVGVFPVNINSNLVSAQNRNRWYWTNIRTKNVGLFNEVYSDIQQPKDKGILLRDILESEVNEKYYLSDKMLTGLQKHSDKKQSEGCGFKFEPKNANIKASTITSRCFKMGVDDNYIVHNMIPRSSKNGNGGTGHLSRSDGKTYCLDTGQTNAVEIVAMRGRGENNEQQLEPNHTGKTNSLTSVQKDNLLILNERQKANHKNGDEKANTFLSTSWKGSQANGMTLTGESRIRRLTPTECERLQTVPDNYTNYVSDSQRYKMLGNGWTVDVIAHIFSYLE